jgi:2-oxoglutarate ferredoxin oxidoreductase subunit gamma
MARTRLVFSGSGGQGLITAAIILAKAAVLFDNKNAIQSQSYGAAARGGATRSDVIIDDEEILFPKVSHPNILISLTQESYNKYSPIIRPGGLLLVDSGYVQTARKVEARQVALPMYDAVMREINNPVVFNICVLGTLTGMTKVVNPESILKVLKTSIPGAFMDMNQKALELGLEIGKNTA